MQELTIVHLQKSTRYTVKSGYTVHAPAKINLYLDITSKRADGYHTIDTVFQTVSLADTLTFGEARKGIRITVEGPYAQGVPRDSANIVYRAVDMVCGALVIEPSISVRIRKNIPHGAGLGGGSSDAAAVINHLPQLLHKKLSRNSALKLARELGADVPFFIAGGCARGEGIGDTIHPIRNRSRFWIVMVYPGFKMSTSEMYRRIDVAPGVKKILTSSQNIHNIIEYLRRGKSISQWGSCTFNYFERIAFSVYPVLSDISRRMCEAGAEHTLMSGSGSVMCGFSSSYETAQRLKKTVTRSLRRARCDVWLVRPCS